VGATPIYVLLGNRFPKLKAPVMWYDIINVLDVLNHFEPVKDDAHLLEMIDSIKSQQDSNSFYTPEAVLQKFRGWDSG